MRTLATRARAINQYNGLGNQLWDLAGNRPSLDLRFADEKSLVDATTGANLIDFARASSGTYVGSDGLIKTATTDAPRFDHDPTTGESLGLLVEESRTNLLGYSEDISSWSQITGGSPIITPNDAISPDGTNTATRIENTSAIAFLGDTTVFTAGVTYTFSSYFKAGTGDSVTILLYSAGGTAGYWDSQTSNVARTFNLSTGEDLAFPGSVDPTSFPIKAAGNGWYRCSITATCTVTHTGSQQLIRNTSGLGDNILAWGYQIEAGSFPTSYIPTVGAGVITPGYTTPAVTRAADVASISGANFSSWYRQDEGTVFTSSTNRETYPGNNVFPYLAQIDDGTNNNRVSIDFSVLSAGYRYNLVVRNNNAPQFEIGPSGIAQNTAQWAVALKSGDFASSVSVAPTNIYTNTTGVLPAVMTRLTIGDGFGKPFTGTIRRLCYWQTRLPDSTLSTITQ